jgi:hypothetical protein
MRTKEEVFAVLKSYKLSMSDSARVVGFLLGKGVIEKGEIVKFGSYDGRKGGELPIITFNDFYEWFEADEEYKILEGLMNFLQDEQDKALEAGDAKKADELAMYLGFLVDALELEYEEVEEDEAKPRDR